MTGGDADSITPATSLPRVVTHHTRCGGRSGTDDWSMCRTSRPLPNVARAPRTCPGLRPVAVASSRTDSLAPARLASTPNTARTGPVNRTAGTSSIPSMIHGGCDR